MYPRTFENNEIYFFQNFDFLRYFWHKDLKQALMPKVPQKIKRSLTSILQPFSSRLDPADHSLKIFVDLPSSL